MPQAFREINHLYPDFVISVGDLIDGPTPITDKIGQFWKEFDDEVALLQSPFVYLPGNHDIWNATSKGIYQERYGATYRSFNYRGLHFITLDTEQMDESGKKTNRIDGEQLEWLKAGLARSQAVGGARLLGVRADAAHAIEALARTLPRMNGRNIEVLVDLKKPLWFAGEAQDLSELLGNLMDNACKWAAGKVTIAAARSKDRLKVEIGDDGPGIAEEHRAVALQRGGRLDERTPGSGLGLTIATDLARLYGGTLTLGQSPLGGLKVELDLPAAD